MTGYQVTLRPSVVADGQPAMYVVGFDGHQYERRADGSPIGLVEAMRWARGCGGVRIYRVGRDGSMTLVVDRAGDDRQVHHVPTGNLLLRQRARHLRDLAANRPSLWTIDAARLGITEERVLASLAARRAEMVERLMGRTADAPAGAAV